AIMMKRPPGIAAAAPETRSSSARHSPDPAASRVDEVINAAMRPGTATPASGIARRFASTPIGATVPNAYAVIGAVSNVAAAAGAGARTLQWLRRGARPAPITAAIAPTQSPAPVECHAGGTTSSTASAGSADTP